MALDELLDLTAHRPVADEDQFELDADLRQGRRRFDQQKLALLLG